ncbi:carboxypeptidase-like regulatory domain-containing protein [Gangjinia marincola]|uniref:Carboxypeptidase-like regulatory domain-containing protein n=1 Tax=Gangjinia marincola TaxID=578463 RepID=A0ABP3XUQ2_9FLAO
MKRILYLFTFFFIAALHAQTEAEVIKGTVLNGTDDTPLNNVNIINLNAVKGTISDEEGKFEIRATPNDTLYFSYLGFEPIQVKVTNDWTKYGEVKIKMTEVGIALEEVEIKPVKLTGYLEIDAKNIPIYENYRYSISGLNTGYEGGPDQPGAITKVIKSIFNPADFLYNTFGKRGKQMRKLRKMKEDDEIRNLLQSKYDRQTLSALLQITKVDIDEILRRCSYSDDFIKTANDLQLLDAISGCYEDYKVLEQKN